MFSLGMAELIFLGVFAFGGFIVLAVIMTLVLRNSRNSATNWQAPIAAGPPSELRAIQPTDPPIAPSARWQGSELFIRALQASTKSLFDVPLKNLEQCLITYRFQIQTDGNRTTVYPELWCRLPESGQFFSRGVYRKICKTQDWTQVEIPFYLASGQQADLLHLNLVFEQPGAVRMKDIAVVVAPTKA